MRAPKGIGAVKFENMAAAWRYFEIETIAQCIEPRQSGTVVDQSIAELLFPTKERIELSSNSGVVDGQVKAVDRVRFRNQPCPARVKILQADSRNTRVRDQSCDVDSSPIEIVFRD